MNETKTTKIPPQTKDSALISCKSGEIDDEFHLIYKCKTHNTERKNLFAKINPHISASSSSTPNETLNSILNSENKKVILEIGKFLKTAFRKRKLENSE